MWLKICGVTTPEAIAAAIDARASAIGFVFTPSVRQLTSAQAITLAAPARGRIRCVAVMRAPTQALLDEVLHVFQPDAVQADATDLASLRLPRDVVLLPVFRAGAPLPAKLPVRLLLEGPESGAGVAIDWNEAAALARRTEVVLAGGLTPDNVADAIAQVRPFGVDVSSGVEIEPGVKSPVKIARFVAAAHAAFARSAA
jgi:phosphoribosylanthranilate isomerase